MGCLIYCLAALFSPEFFGGFLSGKVCAYLDPGTGSFIIQILVAGLFGMLLVLKLFWNSIKIFFSNLFTRNKDRGKDEN